MIEEGKQAHDAKDYLAQTRAYREDRFLDGVLYLIKHIYSHFGQPSILVRVNSEEKLPEKASEWKTLMHEYRLPREWQLEADRLQELYDRNVERNYPSVWQAMQASRKANH